MTREEILVELYKVNRVCRGAPRFTQAARDSLTLQLSTCSTGVERTALVQSMAAILGVPSLPVGNDKFSIQTLIYSFGENCNQDFNVVISTYPFDGQARDVACPRCGTMQHFQSPLVG